MSTDFTLIRVRKDTHDAIKVAADAAGMKMWAFADRAVNAYLQTSSGGCD